MLGLVCLLPPLPDPRRSSLVCLTRKLQPQTSTHVLVSVRSSSSFTQTINASASLPIGLPSLEMQAVSRNAGRVPSRGFLQVSSAPHPSLISFPGPCVCRLPYPPNHSQTARSRSIPPSIRKRSHPLKVQTFIVSTVPTYNISDARFLYLCVRTCAQSCPTLCNPVDCTPPGSSAHGISQARIEEWVAVSFSKGSSRPRDQTCISCIGRWILSR